MFKKIINYFDYDFFFFFLILLLSGHGVMSDAVRTRGGDPVQTGTREERYHQGDLVGKITGNFQL